jgi:hypothetical protein
VVSLAWSITQAADAVFFGIVVVALPADLMVKTVGGQARSCVSQLVVRFHPVYVDHGFSGIELPLCIIPLDAVGFEGVDRISVCQEREDRVRWPCVVDTVIDIRVS